MRNHGLEVVVFAFKARGGTMVEFRSDRYIPFAGEAFGDVSNMRVHTESFLENQHTGILAVARWTRPVCIHLCSVVHIQRNCLSRDAFHQMGPFTRALWKHT